ncbi:transposase [uncultured Litoreibacter sp.]|uniref:transposase n=1 Tax=uncultured Litoreibacter sp. TaxID=1392394 RepID=UPI00345841A4
MICAPLEAPFETRWIGRSVSPVRNSMQFSCVVGLLTASAIVATVGNASQYRNSRELAAWLDLTHVKWQQGKVWTHLKDVGTIYQAFARHGDDLAIEADVVMTR